MDNNAVQRIPVTVVERPAAAANRARKPDSMTAPIRIAVQQHLRVDRQLAPLERERPESLPRIDPSPIRSPTPTVEHPAEAAGVS